MLSLLTVIQPNLGFFVATYISLTSHAEEFHMILLFAILLVLAATVLLLVLPTRHRTGLETEWDDPAPERYLKDMAAHYLPHAPRPA